LIFPVLVVSASAFSLLQGLVLPVLSTLQHALHTSQDTVTWVLTAYLLSASVATPILGRVGDMMGKKRVLVAVLITLALGSVLGAVATSIGVMVLARVIQGVGGAVLPLSFGIIRDEAPKAKIPSSISIIGALGAVGAGAGVVLAGPIVDALNIHWLFLIPAVIVGLAALAAIVFVPESTSRASGHIAVVPALLLSGWLVALIIAVSEGQQWGWASGRILGLVVLTIGLLTAWIVVEMRVRQPLIDMRMMALPAVWTTNLVALLFGAGVYSAFSFLPEFVETPSRAGYGFGASVTGSGLFLLPMTVTMFAFGIVSSHMAARIGSKLVLFIGSLSTVVPFGIMAFAHHARWEIYLASGLLGVGLGLAFAAMSNRIVEAVPANQVGVASGMNANIRTIGGAIGAAVVAAIITSGTRVGKFPLDAAYRNGFTVLLAAGVLASLVCLLIPRAPRDEEAMLAEAHAVPHGETALMAGAALVDEA
jgi:EmrB/QacA subfamily drug resistance transporter